jgi:hypothetical protein
MKGSNILKVNSGTVVEAMQEYLNRRALIQYPADKVISVSVESGWFSFTVEERKKSEDTK